MIKDRTPYYNGWCVSSPAPDLGHEWGPVYPERSFDWDGARCTLCGHIASNVEIATANTPICPSIQ